MSSKAKDAYQMAQEASDKPSRQREGPPRGPTMAPRQLISPEDSSAGPHKAADGYPTGVRSGLRRPHGSVRHRETSKMA